MLEDKNNPEPELVICQLHQKTVKWHCGGCGEPLCPDCKPVGYNYQVFHSKCLLAAQTRQQARSAANREIEAPSLGVKILAWIFIVLGIVALGTALLLLGFSWLGHALPIRALLSGPVAPNLDSIPGGRVWLYWIAGFSVVASFVALLVGIGFLNCVEATRKLLLFFAWLEVIGAGLGWLLVLLHGSGFWDVPIIGVFLIIYLGRRDIRRQFEKVL